MNNLISRRAAIDELWKALYEYEDKTEKQFMESEELDIEDWIQHRIFAQNMNDIDRQAILSLPSAQHEQRWIPVTERLPEENGTYLVCYEDATVLLDWFNGKWFFYRTNPAIEETGTVIAWRPLPEPYKEEEIK